MQRVAVVIPTHKEELDDLEKISHAQCRKVLGHYPIIYAIPEGKDLAWIPKGSQIVHMPHLGKGIDHYNILLKSPQFYEAFFDYEYILIYHVDAFVFYDALEYFCSLGYDYIGAPWQKWYTWITNRNLQKFLSRVGNGGFCLRKVKACINLLTNHSDLAQQHKDNEDFFFSICGKIPDLDFNVAPYDVACEFSIEHNAQRIIKRNGGHLPFGCHKWFAYDSDFFLPFFLKLGYDLRPLKHQLDNMDRDLIRQGLTEEALRRLIGKLNRDGGKGIIRYLPTREFASVRVLVNDNTTKIFEAIYPYEDDTDKITLHKDLQVFFYDKWPALINDLKAERFPHLIIDYVNDKYYTPLNDANYLSTKLEQRGLHYGEHVISFCQEYLNYCERLFHNLGK